MADDIMDSSLTRRGQICWYQKPEIGLDAINDALLLQACIFRLLKLYCGEQPYYLNLMELFLQVCCRPGLSAHSALGLLDSHLADVRAQELPRFAWKGKKPGRKLGRVVVVMAARRAVLTLVTRSDGGVCV